jgi:hypothetical protein
MLFSRRTWVDRRSLRAILPLAFLDRVCRLVEGSFGHRNELPAPFARANLA